MSRVTADTRVVRVRGELFISVTTLEELKTNMAIDDPIAWLEEIQTLNAIIKNAYIAAGKLNI